MTEKRKNTLQAIIDHLVDSGLSDFGANQLLHINMPALGEYKSVMDCIRNGEWDQAWGTVDAYLAGDYIS